MYFVQKVYETQIQLQVKRIQCETIEDRKTSFAACASGSGARLVMRNCSVLRSSCDGVMVDRGAELLVEDCDLQNSGTFFFFFFFLFSFFSFLKTVK
jgi:hypothetical protein